MKEGATPLDIDELQGLRIRISTRKELDDAEYINIVAGIDWAAQNPLPIYKFFHSTSGSRFMNARIAQALRELLDRHRVVFWYDAKNELADEFAAFELDGVEKLKIANNEFGLKYRILRRQPEARFLLYHGGPRPADADNWLLDILLANAAFQADRASLWLAELGLGPEFRELAESHAEFFRSPERLHALKASLSPNDGANSLRRQMLAICAGVKPAKDARTGFETILGEFLAELAQDANARFALAAACGLAEFFWAGVEEHFGYKSGQPTLRDFSLELFRAAAGMTGQTGLDAGAFFSHWKNEPGYGEAFRRLSRQASADLGAVAWLGNVEIDVIADLDCFREIDQKIIASLINAVCGEAMTARKVEEIIAQRRHLFWYREYEPLYDAILAAASLLALLAKTGPAISSAQAAIASYCESWFRLDQYYRRYCAASRQAAQPTLLRKLTELVDSRYVNNYLFPLACNFQAVLPQTWQIGGVPRMDEFFETFIHKRYLANQASVCVIISDALRYEAADELRRLLQSQIDPEAGFTFHLEPMLAMLPSFTQLGMAALLPHQNLAFAESDPETILVDGIPARADNRNRLLQAAGGCALKAEQVLAEPAPSLAAILSAQPFCYIYHNHIDALGDKLATEHIACQAVSAALNELAALIRKLAASAACDIIVTADHGFLFQAQPPDEGDFGEPGPCLDGKRRRRYIVGRNLQGQPGLRRFTASQLGLGGDSEILLAGGLGRFRVAGAGSRFVHGGASLQEAVVPALTISRQAKSGQRHVKFALLDEGRDTITTNQIALKFRQLEPVGGDLLPLELRAGFYGPDGAPVSSAATLAFTSASRDAPEQQAVFALNASAAAWTGKEIYLRLEEKIPNTSQYRELGRRPFGLRSAFAADFDAWD